MNFLRKIHNPTTVPAWPAPKPVAVSASLTVFIPCRELKRTCLHWKLSSPFYFSISASFCLMFQTKTCRYVTRRRSKRSKREVGNCCASLQRTSALVSIHSLGAERTRFYIQGIGFASISRVFCWNLRDGAAKFWHGGGGKAWRKPK